MRCSLEKAARLRPSAPLYGVSFYMGRVAEVFKRRLSGCRVDRLKRPDRLINRGMSKSST